MGRSPCCSKVGLRRGPWSSKEDAMLTDFIQKNGEGQWRSLPKKAGLLRCGKSCRLRWMNYLRPGIKRGNIGEDEEDLIVRLHGLLGNRWSLIAGRLPGRTDNEIKNYWNTHLLKKLNSAGIQQNSHKELPKPNKKNKSQKKNDALKKKQKQKKNKKADANAVADTDKAKPEETPIEQLDNDDDPPKIKVYLPKPIRVTPSFPRVNSYDSLGSRTSSSDGGETAEKASESYAPVALSTFLELEDFPFVDGVDEDKFLGGGYILPVLHSDSSSSDANMLDIMLDEFRQLV